MLQSGAWYDSSWYEERAGVLNCEISLGIAFGSWQISRVLERTLAVV